MSKSTKKLTIRDFIDRAIKKHGNLYDYSLSNYINAKVKIEIICNKHGSFWQTPNNHLNNKGCLKCGIESRTILQRDNNEKFIEKANLVHNFKYDYSKVDYINNTTKIIIICPIHKEFKQNPSNHLIGNNCPKCAKETTRLKRTKSEEDFLQKVNEKYNNKYDYSKIKYVNLSTKIEIICPIHGSFLQSPLNHLSGGCKKCGIEFIAREKIKKAKEKFNAQASKIHNNFYDYSLVEYEKAKKKVKIICPLHGEFLQIPDRHLRGSGCDLCGNNKSSEFHKQNTLGWSHSFWKKLLKNLNILIHLKFIL